MVPSLLHDVAVASKEPRFQLGMFTVCRQCLDTEVYDFVASYTLGTTTSKMSLSRNTL